VRRQPDRSPSGRADALTRLLTLCAVAVPITLAACSGAVTVSQPTTSTSTTSTSTTDATPSATPSPSTTTSTSVSTSTSSSSPPAGPGLATTVRLAFGGDTNTANSAGRVLTAGMGSAAAVLAKADLAMVNIETALADDRSGLVPEPKSFNFVAPTRLLDIVGKAGVDVVTVANNHGLDFGQVGLKRTLAARSASRPHLIGAGTDFAAAFTPYRTTVRGRGVMFLAATDVLDAGLPWEATATRPGLASIKSKAGYAALRGAVRSDRTAHPDDVIAVYLHAGVELNVCPTSRQRQVAADLASDGASAVLMSHAHVVQPGAVIHDTAVAYGLGNFVFAAQSAATAQTGVMEIDVPPTGPPTQLWHPGRISGGIPTIFSGSAAGQAQASWKALGSGC
jgi:poly-gamma-glutamate capsule biosynthesis protein CapA/YwtB (metallophosphatase superfamily)